MGPLIGYTILRAAIRKRTFFSSPTLSAGGAGGAGVRMWDELDEDEGVREARMVA